MLASHKWLRKKLTCYSAARLEAQPLLYHPDGRRRGPAVIRHERAIELEERLQERIQQLEEHLDIEETWTADDEQWQAAMDGLVLRKYNKELDTVIKLNLQRILEQHKAGVAGTGTYLFSFISHMD